jgi:anti-sigma regulatory factor (Ser/Thr protein kinase)
MLRSGDHDGEIGALTVPLSSFDANHGGKISLTVPARPEAVRVVRAVMRTWAATIGFLLDEIEELCLAVDEAFAGLIAARPAPTCVIVRIRREGDGVDITAVRDTQAELWPPVSAQTALVRRVLTTLIDEVHFEQTDEGPAIHMVKRRAPVSAPPNA